MLRDTDFLEMILKRISLPLKKKKKIDKEKKKEERKKASLLPFPSFNKCTFSDIWKLTYEQFTNFIYFAYSLKRIPKAQDN